MRFVWQHRAGSMLCHRPLHQQKEEHSLMHCDQSGARCERLLPDHPALLGRPRRAATPAAAEAESPTGATTAAAETVRWPAGLQMISATAGCSVPAAADDAGAERTATAAGGWLLQQQATRSRVRETSRWIIGAASATQQVV